MNNKIAKNTLLLYIRQIVALFVSLYTSRIVLDALGTEDFGIYSVVGGLVAMFSLISGSLSSAVTRFLSFELGKENEERLKNVFSTSVTLHMGLALIVLILLETIGVWFLNNKMNIPTGRMQAANWVLQFSILTFVINLLGVPYNAAIIANERMGAFAYVSIIEVTLKLCIAFIIVSIGFDKLIIYALLLVIVSIIIRIVYGVYCRANFKECKYSFSYDNELVREMVSFAGWSFIGVSSAVLRNQGVNVLINIFYSTVVNAARGISMQVNVAITSFVNNFMTAMKPQIIKSYANGEFRFLYILILRGAKYSFFLIYLLALPVLIETEQILSFWLKDVPLYTISFVRLILVFSLIESLSGTLTTAMLATGQIKYFQIVVGGIQMLNFPISYFLLKLGLSPESTYIASIILSILCLFARLVFLQKKISLPIKLYVKDVLLKAIFVFVFSAILPIYIYLNYLPGLVRLIYIVLGSFGASMLFVYTMGLKKAERDLINLKVLGLINNKK